MATLRSVHPVVEVGDMLRALRWYEEALGFRVAFDDGGSPPGYAGLERDGVTLHLQAHTEPGWTGGNRIDRILVDDPDALFAELRARSDAFDGREIADTPWGTREFGQYDPDRNAILFYAPR